MHPEHQPPVPADRNDLPPMLQLPGDFRIDSSLSNIPRLRGLDDDTIICLFAGHRLIQRTSGPPALSPHDHRDVLGPASLIEVIGTHQGRTCLAVSLPDGTDTTSLPPGWEASGLRNWFGHLPDDLASIAMQGSQLLDWRRTHRFCGRCGTPTLRCPNERAVQCPRCALRNYPRISPAMMVLITRERQLLLASNISFPPDRYSALAGFLEAGETVEAALHREVQEEVGIRVHRLQWFGSQSWPFPHSLMLAFTAEWLDGDIRIDPSELRDARWFDADALPDLPPAGISISRALIEHTAARLRRR